MNDITAEIYKNFELLPKDLQGWNGTNTIFEKLINEVKPKHIMEIGTWKGQSAINMAHIIQKLNSDCKITCVDTWLGALEFWDDLKDTAERNLMLKNGYPQIYYQFLSNVIHEGVQNIIFPFPTTSSIASKYFAKKKITAQLIYIDGSHDYKDVSDDCINYWNLLDPHGILFGDDWKWDSVRQSVTEFAEKNKLKIHHYDSEFWHITKS